MKPISEAAKRKAVEIANAEAGVEYFYTSDVGGFNEHAITSFARHLDEVSEIAREVSMSCHRSRTDGQIGGLMHVTALAVNKLAPLILPDEPDELEAAVKFVWWSARSPESFADALATELAKRQLQITKVQP